MIKATPFFIVQCRYMKVNNDINVRKVTCQLLEAANEGYLSWEAIARTALSYLSEAEVAEMAQINELYIIEEEYDYEEDLEA